MSDEIDGAVRAIVSIKFYKNAHSRLFGDLFSEFVQHVVQRHLF